MNIFVLDRDPYVAAENMCDKHIVKMIIETNQILSCVIDKCGKEGRSIELELAQYPKAHAKHPCTLWAMESKSNAIWLVNHLKGIENEFRIRYPRKVHSMDGNYRIYSSEIQKCTFKRIGLTPFAQAMPEPYKANNPVTAYRTYYLMDKGNFATWKKETPRWYKYGRQLMLNTIQEETKDAKATSC
jgi:hypothetical protein